MGPVGLMDSPSGIVAGDESFSDESTDGNDASADAALNEQCVPGEWDPTCLPPPNDEPIDVGVTSGSDGITSGSDPITASPDGTN